MGKTRGTIQEKSWTVQRTAILEEMELSNGGIRFRVSVADEGRKPFLVRWFNDISPASDFIDHLAEGGVARN